eukprot:COSAG01_NODE_11360_length_1946_cov_1.406368_2_plen_43_part_01
MPPKEKRTEEKQEKQREGKTEQKENSHRRHEPAGVLARAVDDL